MTAVALAATLLGAAAVPPVPVPPPAPAPPPRQELVVGRMRPERVLLVGDEPAPWSPEKLRGIAPDPRVTAMVRALGDESFAARDAASTALRGTDVPDVQVWLHLSGAAGALPYEAHARLLEIARSRIVDAPRGALGIQMAPRFAENDGVVVTGLIPNMPAKKVLVRGDRIVELDGLQIRNSQDLANLVQDKRPGERIRAVVMRAERDEFGRIKGGADPRASEKRVDLELEIGSRADLERFGDGGMDIPVGAKGREQQAQRLVDAFPASVRSLPAVRVPGEPIDVDSHPEIVLLKEQLARPEGLGVGFGVRAILRSKLSSLEAAVATPGLTDDERAWFEAVAKRFRELIPEELRPDLRPPVPTPE